MWSGECMYVSLGEGVVCEGVMEWVFIYPSIYLYIYILERDRNRRLGWDCLIGRLWDCKSGV
jgi:hypothetical protein